MTAPNSQKPFRVPADKVRTRAKYLYEEHSDWLDIDDDAHVSEVDYGYWVQAWVWVENNLLDGGEK